MVARHEGLRMQALRHGQAYQSTLIGSSVQIYTMCTKVPNATVCDDERPVS